MIYSIESVEYVPENLFPETKVDAIAQLQEKLEELNDMNLTSQQKMTELINYSNDLGFLFTDLMQEISGNENKEGSGGVDEDQKENSRAQMLSNIQAYKFTKLGPRTTRGPCARPYAGDPTAAGDHRMEAARGDGGLAGAIPRSPDRNGRRAGAEGQTGDSAAMADVPAGDDECSASEDAERRTELNKLYGEESEEKTGDETVRIVEVKQEAMLGDVILRQFAGRSNDP